MFALPSIVMNFHAPPLAPFSTSLFVSSFLLLESLVPDRVSFSLVWLLLLLVLLVSESLRSAIEVEQVNR